MPTMNVFFVGFPIKIGAGLAVLALSLPLFSYGGSFLLTCYLAVGILHRIYMERGSI